MWWTVSFFPPDFLALRFRLSPRSQWFLICNQICELYTYLLTGLLTVESEIDKVVTHENILEITFEYTDTITICVYTLLQNMATHSTITKTVTVTKRKLLPYEGTNHQVKPYTKSPLWVPDSIWCWEMHQRPHTSKLLDRLRFIKTKIP